MSERGANNLNRIMYDNPKLNFNIPLYNIRDCKHAFKLQSRVVYNLFPEMAFSAFSWSHKLKKGGRKAPNIVCLWSYNLVQKHQKTKYAKSKKIMIKAKFKANCP